MPKYRWSGFDCYEEPSDEEESDVTNEPVIQPQVNYHNSFIRDNPCYSISNIWRLLDEFNTIIPWKETFPGSPTYVQVFALIEDKFSNFLESTKNEYTNRFNLLKAQIEFNKEYENKYYNELR